MARCCTFKMDLLQRDEAKRPRRGSHGRGFTVFSCFWFFTIGSGNTKNQIPGGGRFDKELKVASSLFLKFGTLMLNLEY